MNFWNDLWCLIFNANNNQNDKKFNDLYLQKALY